MLEHPERRKPQGLVLTGNQQGRFLNWKTLRDYTLDYCVVFGIMKYMTILNKRRRAIKCKWCNKKIVVPYGKGWDKQKFCSIKCREEYHSFNDKRSRFYKANKTKAEILTNPDLYVKCEICGQLARRRLSTHIKAKHNLNWDEYVKRFPNAKNECKEITDVIYPEIRKKKGFGIHSVCFKNGWDTITNDRKKKIGNQCELCGFNEYPEAMIGHHKLPRYLDGKDKTDNCILLCANCHRHIHKLIREIVKQKNYTIEDIVRTCEKSQEANSKS